MPYCPVLYSYTVFSYVHNFQNIYSGQMKKNPVAVTGLKMTRYMFARTYSFFYIVFYLYFSSTEKSTLLSQTGSISREHSIITSSWKFIKLEQ